MLRFIVVLASFFATTAPAATFNHRPTLRALKSDLRSGDPVALATRADRTLDAMVRLAVWKLRLDGYRDEAQQLEDEWQTDHEGQLVALVSGAEDIGDHAPLSPWLADVYERLEALLGVAVMELLHLDDIKIVNYAIPVVFHLDAIGDDVVTPEDFELHFDPFCGVLAYWGTWAACEVVTAGTGWFIVCTPAGMIAEYATVNYIAPPLSPRVYALFYSGRQNVGESVCGR